MQQPEYSNNSSASTTLAGAAMNSFTAASETAAVSYDVMAPANLEHSLQQMPPHQQGGDQHEDEEESGADFSVAVGSTAVAAAEVIYPAEVFHRR
ncbi:unnamed protein product [Arabis nemorensis]|uniref:Uncharacterized protein n=1 Tax=Arabis nemorensis TaxID=586526 RepID=A0A565B3Y1_9BRAS|nr:unnamed protein product [Arabis nemorensis]